MTVAAARAPPPHGPLAGLLVLDLSRILAGPYCTMTLGDLGARVIKVEAPGTGDDTRGWGPPFWNGISTYYLAINRNKESVTLDFTTPGGRAVLADLVARADVLVENFRPGTLDRWGLDYDACAALNPRLVYASVSGYGLAGPDRDRAGYDLIAQGEGGLMSVTGEDGDPPLKSGASQADIVAGLWLLNGILAALYARETSGRGQRVDTSLLDGQIGMLLYYATNTWATGEAPERLGNRHPNLMPYGTFRCRDAWITRRRRQRRAVRRAVPRAGRRARGAARRSALRHERPSACATATRSMPTLARDARRARRRRRAGPPARRGRAERPRAHRARGAGRPAGRRARDGRAAGASRDPGLPRRPACRSSCRPRPGRRARAAGARARTPTRVLAELGYDAAAIARLRAAGALG